MENFGSDDGMSKSNNICIDLVKQIFKKNSEV